MRLSSLIPQSSKESSYVALWFWDELSPFTKSSPVTGQLGIRGASNSTYMCTYAPAKARLLGARLVGSGNSSSMGRGSSSSGMTSSFSRMRAARDRGAVTSGLKCHVTLCPGSSKAKLLFWVRPAYSSYSTYRPFPLPTCLSSCNLPPHYFQLPFPLPSLSSILPTSSLTT